MMIMIIIIIILKEVKENTVLTRTHFKKMNIIQLKKFLWRQLGPRRQGTGPLTGRGRAQVTPGTCVGLRGSAAGTISHCFSLSAPPPSSPLNKCCTNI